MKTSLIRFFIFFTLTFLIGQDSQGGQPLSFQFNLNDDYYRIVTTIVDNEEILREDQNRLENKQFRYG